MPIYEPGLRELIARNCRTGRLAFVADAKAAVEHGEVLFIAVGTPADEDGAADLRYVLAAARDIGRYATMFKVVVNKSTVPVGTAERVKAAIEAELTMRGADPVFSVVSNPEFLKEGAAIDDFAQPDRIIVGCDKDAAGERARECMRLLYAPFNRRHERTIYMDVRSAELTKYAANAMLATRISFINEFANFADCVGADIEFVRRGIGADSRIGYDFLYPGCGYGGACFPKDLQSLITNANGYQQDMHIVKAVSKVNDAQKGRLLAKIVERFGAQLTNRKFALWGLSFKPDTDDMRNAPSRRVIAGLLERGATVIAYDPVAASEASRVLTRDLAHVPDLQRRLIYAADHMQMLQSADALVVITEWTTFKRPDFEIIKRRMKNPIVFDGRNLYEPGAMSEMGIE